MKKVERKFNFNVNVCIWLDCSFLGRKISGERYLGSDIVLGIIEVGGGGFLIWSWVWFVVDGFII